MTFPDIPELIGTHTNYAARPIRCFIARMKLELWANRRLVIADALATAASVIFAQLVETATNADVELRNILVLAPLAALIGLPVYACSGFYRKHASSTSVPDLLRYICAPCASYPAQRCTSPLRQRSTSSEPSFER